MFNIKLKEYSNRGRYGKMSNIKLKIYSNRGRDVMVKCLISS